MEYPNLADQEKFYNARWREFDFAGPYKLKRAAAILDAISRLGLSRPSIIDLGCGAGWLTSILGQFGPTTGVDFAGEAISNAESRYPHVRFRRIDLARWAPDESEYDLVVSHEVIEHLEDQDNHLKLARDLLRPGGYLILTTPNADVLHAMPEERRKAWSSQPIENWLRIPELRRMLRGLFEIDRITTIIPGHPCLGPQGLLTHKYARGVARRLCILPMMEHISCRMGAGLHILAVVRRS